MDWVRAARYLSLTTAALLFLAALWYALYILELTTPAAPGYDASRPRSENLHAFFTYQRSVAWQERGFTLVAGLAFLLLAPVGAVLREILGRRTSVAAMAGSFSGVAACLLVAGQLIQVGTQQAVLSASEHEFGDPELLSLMWDTGLVISNWLENGGYFSLALSVVGWAVLAPRVKPVPRAWIALSGVLSAALLVVVVSQALEVWTIYEVVLAVSGAVLAPAWFLLTARVCAVVAASGELNASPDLKETRG